RLRERVRDAGVGEPAARPDPAGGRGSAAALRPAGTQRQPVAVAGSVELGRTTLMVAVAALVVGVVLGLVFEPSVPLALQPYLPIAVVAALDAVFGGIRAKLDGIFDDKQFVISFVSNVLVAALIASPGAKLGVGSPLSTGAAAVLGVRIFGNVAGIRPRLFRA